MLRMLLWALFLYVVWKVVNAVISPSSKETPSRQDGGGDKERFHNVQEAEFEDITKKQEP